jgi:hypothetical protein
MTSLRMCGYRSWTSLENYLQSNVVGFSGQQFTPHPSLSPYLNYSLGNMHTQACHDYICEHVKRDELQSIFIDHGLPMPFLLESNRDVLRSLSIDIPVIFDDSTVYSHWVNQNLQIIEPYYSPFLSPQQFDISFQKSNMRKPFSSVCLSPEQSDYVEMQALLLSTKVERLDNMSVMSDPIINRIMSLYLYLNNPSHELYLHQVVHSICDDYPSTSMVSHFVARIVNVSKGRPDHDLPNALNEVAQICLFYRNGVRGDTLITYIEQLTTLSSCTDYNRIQLLKQLLVMSEKSLTETPSYPINLTIINSLTSPNINTNETIVSNSVSLNHLQINGKKLFITDIYN